MIRYLTIAAGALCAVASLARNPARAVVYDNFEKPGGYTLQDYATKWSNPYGPGEMAYSDTRNFDGGQFNVSAAPFQTGSDFSVYDHLKYLAVSNQSFAVPTGGSITMSATSRPKRPAR